MLAAFLFCRFGLLAQVDVMGDVVNFFVLLEEGSAYLYWALAVMCTSAWDSANQSLVRHFGARGAK